MRRVRATIVAVEKVIITYSESEFVAFAIHNAMREAHIVTCGLSGSTVLFACGNKMPTRCNRGFYCRSYCLLNVFRAPLCPSSGAQEYYTVVAACGISCCGFQVAGLVWSCNICKICNKNLCCI